MRAATTALLRGPNFAHVATLMPDGSPHVAPVWVDVEDGRIRFHKEADSIACRNLRRDPRVAISLVATDDPYRFATVRGEAVEFLPDPFAASWLNEAAVDYTGRPYPPDHFVELGPGTVVVVEPERDASAHIHFLRHDPPAT